MRKTAATPAPALYCRKCSYDLRGQETHRCPECGHPYDPADAKTFRREPRGKAAKWIRRVAAALVLLFLLASTPYAWLYYDWRQEQPAIERMKELGASVQCKAVQPPVLTHFLPARYIWLLDRAATVNAWHVALTDADLILLSHCRRLEQLWTGSPVSARGVEAIGQLRELRELSLTGAEITDASAAVLARSQQLRTLHLKGTSLTDSGLSRLCSLPELSLLWLESRDLTNAGLASLAIPPHLTKLSLCAPSIGDQGLATLSGLTHLSWLYVEADGYTEAGVNDLRLSLGSCWVLVERYTPTAEGLARRHNPFHPHYSPAQRLP